MIFVLSVRARASPSIDCRAASIVAHGALVPGEPEFVALDSADGKSAPFQLFGKLRIFPAAPHELDNCDVALNTSGVVDLPGAP